MNFINQFLNDHLLIVSLSSFSVHKITLPCTYKILSKNNFSLAGKVVDSNQEGRVSSLFVSVQYTASLESVDASAA